MVYKLMIEIIVHIILMISGEDRAGPPSSSLRAFFPTTHRYTCAPMSRTGGRIPHLMFYTMQIYIYIYIYIYIFFSIMQMYHLDYVDHAGHMDQRIVLCPRRTDQPTVSRSRPFR